MEPGPRRQTRLQQKQQSGNRVQIAGASGELVGAARVLVCTFTNIDGRGFFLSPTANPFAVAFTEDLHMFAGLSGMKDFFFDYGRKCNFRWYPSLTTKTSGTPSSAHTSNSCEPRDTFANCQERMEDVGWSSRVGKSSWRTKHTTREGTTASNPECQSSRINVNCGSTVVNSWTRGTCRTDRSHMTWALEEITLPSSCNLCAQEFANVLRTCSLDPLAVPITRRQLRRTASRTKQRERRASGSTTVVPKPKGDGKVEQKSLNKIMLGAILKTQPTM